MVRGASVYLTPDANAGHFQGNLEVSKAFMARHDLHEMILHIPHHIGSGEDVPEEEERIVLVPWNVHNESRVMGRDIAARRRAIYGILDAAALAVEERVVTAALAVQALAASYCQPPHAALSATVAIPMRMQHCDKRTSACDTHGHTAWVQTFYLRPSTNSDAATREACATKLEDNGGVRPRRRAALLSLCVEGNRPRVAAALEETFGGVVWCPVYDARASSLDASWASGMHNCHHGLPEPDTLDDGGQCLEEEVHKRRDTKPVNLRIFTTCKDFIGHSGSIQKNAIQSWLELEPKPEIILYGNSIGTAEVCAEFNLTHVLDIASNAYGTPLVSAMFNDANSERRGRGNGTENVAVAYINSDIILDLDFMTAIATTAEYLEDFLMVGGRVNVPDWMAYSDALQWTRPLAARRNEMHRRVWLHGDLDKPTAIDYFVYSSKAALPSDIPDFAVGRFTWDSWLLDRGHRGLLTVDATNAVLAVHQKHDYSHWKAQNIDRAAAEKRVKPSDKKLHLAEEFATNKLLGSHIQAVFINDSPYRLCCGHTSCSVQKRSR
jgi:hypothetical protein